MCSGLCFMDMENIDIAAVFDNKREIESNVCLKTLTVTNIWPDSDFAVKRFLIIFCSFFLPYRMIGNF